MIFLKFLVMALTRDRWSLTCRLLRTDYLRHVREPFPGCGNRRKGGIARPEADHFLGRLDLPCIKTYMESFPRIAGRHMNFNCYSYGAGDCLPTHDDTAPTGQAARSVYGVPLRRLALTTYLHEEWHPPQTRDLSCCSRYRGSIESAGWTPRAAIRDVAPLQGGL